MKKTFAAEEAQEQATRVLLATLSIPDGADGPSDLTRHLDIEEQHISNIRYANLPSIWFHYSLDLFMHTFF